MPKPDNNGFSLTIRQFADWGKVSGKLSRTLLRRPVCGVSNDSRTVGEGDVFVALTTEKDDGHRYVSAALSRGAVAALVDKKKTACYLAKEQSKLIPVVDPLAALQRIAARYRKTLGIPVVGITGSSGKTTARMFIAETLKQGKVVGETSGNLNNHIGVPLSLLRFTGNEEVGVIEMGANHAREIHDLSIIVRPTIGVITSIGYAHIGYFGSLKNILATKLEIIDGMDDKNGFLMLNGDDTLLLGAAKRLRHDVVLFGFSSKCHLRARNVQASSGGMSFTVGTTQYRLSMAGRHFIYSALLAIHLGRHFGIDDRRIAAALRTIKPAAMRGNIRMMSGATFIIDCYNANPSSMKSGIELLNDVAGKRRKVAIIGDMLELGKYSRSLHRALGRQLALAGVGAIIAVGEFASSVADGAFSAGFKKKDITVAPDSARALAPARHIIRPGDAVLLKGSRGVHLETVYEGFARKRTERHAFTH
jgi:UDP-N-acetylmuramoyl-tripeptide--D-alanyl-D-alanine ligase